MKFAKLSLAAIMAMGVSAFADVQNIKVSGDAKLYYSTSDAHNGDLFSQDSSAGQAALDIAASADLADGVAGKIGVTMLNTLGLENNLVGNVWDGGVGNQWWVSEAWLAKKIANTTVKVGRQTLDTPLAFTETWSISQNTFDAAVVLNNDIPDTTLVAAWVGRGNGGNGSEGAILAGVTRDASNGADSFASYSPAIGKIAEEKYGVNPADFQDGAYAFGAVTTALPMTTAQAWYYDVNDVATALWLQADIALEDELKGLTLGAQYATLDLNDADLEDGSIWAVKVGYAMENGLSLGASYSSSDKSSLGAGWNTATGTGASKIYTEAWWAYGHVTASDTDSYTLEAEYEMHDVADFAVYYTNADHAESADMTEITVTASKSFGSLDATLAYINTDKPVDQTSFESESDNMVQVYLTYNF